MFKSIWNFIVKACKAVKAVVTGKYKENFSTEMTEETILITSTTPLDWTKWFNGKYRFKKENRELKFLRTCSKVFSLIKNVVFGGSVGFVTYSVIIGSMTVPVFAAHLAFYATCYLLVAFNEAMVLRFS